MVNVRQIYNSDSWAACDYFYPDQLRCSEIIARAVHSIFGDLNFHALVLVGVPALIVLTPILFKIIPWERREFIWEEE